MGRVVFLLEEPSMQAFLEECLPRALPQMRFVCVRHGGIRYLEASIPRDIFENEDSTTGTIAISCLS